MTPTFNTLPTINCPEWAPESVQTEYKVVCNARQAIETKRADVLKALQKARNQDLAVYTPVKYDARPMLQMELQFRRIFDAYLRNLSTAAAAYVNECIAEVERAREEVKKDLLKIGYLEPGAVPGRGSYTPEFLTRHPLVRNAIEKRDSGFDVGPTIRANQQEVTSLEFKLRELLVSAAS